MRGKIAWLTHAVLLTGVLVRAGLWYVQPAEIAYDDHFTPILLYAQRGQMPRAEECWECYQPPLYYWCASSVVRGIASFADASNADAVLAFARKSVQFLSLLAGCATLYVALAILRRVCAPAPLVEAVAIGVPAVLPQHVYMSAMVTNDALTYLLASLAVWAALWAFAPRGPTPTAAPRLVPVLLCGALAGLSVLAKGYGLVTVAAIGLCASGTLIARFLAAGGAARVSFVRGVLVPLLVLGGAAAATGVWPTVTNLARYGRAHVDNFEVIDNGMLQQLPGSLAQVDFFSFRYGRLLQWPWLHVAHLDSFWTELYARVWFDYEGMMVSLRLAPEWHAHAARVGQRFPRWNRDRWRAMLNWTPEAVPADLRRSAIAAYLAGLPLTALLIAGAVLGLRRGLRDAGAALISVHGFACLAVPLVQTLRLPLFSAMKAAFALSALSSLPVFAALALAALPALARRILIVLVALCLLTLQATNVLFILAVQRMLLSP